MAQYHKPSWEIAGLIKEFEKLENDTESYGTPDFASSIGLQSLRNHQAQLREELAVARLLESQYALEVCVDGDPVASHAVNSRFFGKFLVCLQDFVNALAFAQAKGSRRRKRLIQNNRLALAATGAGSFAAKFTTPQNEGEGNEGAALLSVEPKLPLDLLSELLDGARDIDDSSDILSNPSVKSRYTKIMSLMAAENADVVVRTRANPYGVRLKAGNARDRQEWLGLFAATTVEKTIHGRLIQGHIKTGHVIIESEMSLFSCQSSEQALRELLGISLGSNVIAILEVTTTTHSDTRFVPKTSYFLKSVKTEASLFSDEFITTTQIVTPTVAPEYNTLHTRL